MCIVGSGRIGESIAVCLKERCHASLFLCLYRGCQRRISLLWGKKLLGGRKEIGK